MGAIASLNTTFIFKSTVHAVIFSAVLKIGCLVSISKCFFRQVIT